MQNQASSRASPLLAWVPTAFAVGFMFPPCLAPYAPAAIATNHAPMQRQCKYSVDTESPVCHDCETQGSRWLWFSARARQTARAPPPNAPDCNHDHAVRVASHALQVHINTVHICWVPPNDSRPQFPHTNTAVCYTKSQAPHQACAAECTKSSGAGSTAHPPQHQTKPVYINSDKQSPTALQHVVIAARVQL